MEGKITLQIEYYQKIVKAKQNFKKSPKDRLTDSYARVRLESLEKLWNSFNSLHDYLVEKFNSDLDKTSYVNDEIYDKAEETYFEYKVELTNLMEDFTNINNPKIVNYKQSSVELPKIAIPKFSGKYNEWITFKDLFLSLIHSNNMLDSVQKMHYLKCSLVGEAEQLLRQVPISEANYETAWLKLKTRYDNKRFLTHNIIKRLLSQKNVSNENGSCLKELLDNTNDCLNGLNNLGIDVSNWDILIIHIISLKLDSETRKQWELGVASVQSDVLPTYEQFSGFLIKRYHALELIDTKTKSNISNQNTNFNLSKIKTLHIRELKCLFCLENHKLVYCKKFIKENIEDRRKFVESKNLCFICLGANHTAKTCRTKWTCKFCNRRHNFLLHKNNEVNKEASNNKINISSASGECEGGTSKETNSGEYANTFMSYFSANKTKQVILATALVTAESKNGKQIIRTLLDQGSQVNLVTENTVQLLGLKKVPARGHIYGLGGDKNIISRAIVNIKIKSRLNDAVIDVRAYVIKTITSLLPEKRVEKCQFDYLGKLDLADPEFNKPSKVDILLGAEIYNLVIKEGISKGPSGFPLAQNTSLGWIISGIVNTTNSEVNMGVSLHCRVNIDDDDLNKILKTFWEIENNNTPEEKMLTDEEKCCEDIFNKTTTRDEDGRYVVKLPFNETKIKCEKGEFFNIAEKRLKCLETKFKNDENYKKRYTDVIKEYLDLGHMEEVKEPDEMKYKSVYLPHHAVMREDKETTKLRVVFDASCKGKNGVSLNDALLVGPKIQPDLRDLILRWRSHYICLAADIIKMYRQVKVEKDDANYQRILWKDESGTIKVYKHLRVTFGTAAAPFLAVRSLQQLSHDEGSMYPLVSEKVITDYYVDDLMTGCETVQEGFEIFKQMNELLSKGGFKLQKWISNDKVIMEKLGKENNEGKVQTEAIKKEIITDTIKILGLTWDSNADEFRYSVVLPELQKPITKRKIISDISKLYDPLGWIAPCIIRAKGLIQKLWLTGIKWDDEATKDIIHEWCTYRESLNELCNIRINRWMGTRIGDNVELHGFCDASKIAYAAVIYVRVINADGNVKTTLVNCKTKVAPINQISIPRLELCGAVLLAKLITNVGRTLKIPKNKMHAWTDSTIVLAWINSPPCKWKVFVANRTSEILSYLEPQQWSHVTSKQNPADHASRGLSPSDLKDNNLWFSGPEFLHKEIIVYSTPKDNSTNLEIITTKTYCAFLNESIWGRFSSLTRMIRVTAHCRRFIFNTKNRNEKKFGILTTKELKEARNCCIRIHQEESFNEEINIIKKNENLPKRSNIRVLNPFLDEENILRVGGRLENSQMNKSRKHPILLTKNSHLTKLLIGDAHKQTLHGGPQLMLCYLQSVYWILGVKQLVKSYFRSCVICAKNMGNIKMQLMGQLPSARVSPSRPFKSSGVDYAGPIQIRTAKGRGQKSHKGYICLFICMATRAVHLEVVTDLTSEGFLQAFKRFVSRRGFCSNIWSDNATNFLGASKELQKYFITEKTSMLHEIAESLATNSCTWHFIPSHSPNFGGLWEAGVKSVKYHLKRVIGQSTLTFEEMTTVLAQIEACLNSRPLSVLKGNDNEEVTVLTPGHFLVGESLVTPPDKNFENSNVSSLRRWQYTQRMLQDFWRQWSRQYLTKFYHRYRWSSIQPQPKLGDIVLVKEDNLPPSRWLYGRIIAEHPGQDNISRVFTLKTKNSTIKRIGSKLCILPIAD